MTCSMPSELKSRTHRIPWADLLRKVHAIDVLACPKCSGRMQLIAFIAEAMVAKRILDHLGLDRVLGPGAGSAAPGASLPVPARFADVVEQITVELGPEFLP
jgi:hypothetical protein